MMQKVDDARQREVDTCELDNEVGDDGSQSLETDVQSNYIE